MRFYFRSQQLNGCPATVKSGANLVLQDACWPGSHRVRQSERLGMQVTKTGLDLATC